MKMPESYTNLVECLANMGNIKKTKPKNGRIRARTTRWNLLHKNTHTKDGFEYEPESLKEHGYKYSIIRDREFHQSKLVLEGKVRCLRSNAANVLTRVEEEMLWSEQRLVDCSTCFTKQYAVAFHITSAYLARPTIIPFIEKLLCQNGNTTSPFLSAFRQGKFT